ncbi:uncharacterized protein CTRU02_203833 [Colletotrichum truncatum]|uniref:Uncharacterized protein n=1 Tax=Colletotrichum truncatum TaxID=5467 RepID=A0ACC3ZAQ0_COLTU
MSGEPVAFRDHSPHQLSMIEEVSCESMPTPPQDDDKVGSSASFLLNHSANSKYSNSDISEVYMHQNTDLNSFDEVTSNVGPHRLQHGSLMQNIPGTVLYGNWEQDNNLDHLNRCSTPDTVIHYDLAEMDGPYDATSSSSDASYRLLACQESTAHNADFKICGALRAKDWSIFQSNLVDYGPDEPSPRIPGCSAGHPYKKTWKLTDSTMMAYNAMRGPMLVPGNDPLRNWMVLKANEAMYESINKSAKRVHETTSEGNTLSQERVDSFSCNKEDSEDTRNMGRDDICTEAQDSTRKGTAGMSGFSFRENQGLDDCAKMLKEANMATKDYAPPELDRNPVYEVPRPRYLHLSPNFEGYKFKDYIPASATVLDPAYKQPLGRDRHFVTEYDISDDEGDPESGRLSPCTFRLLAEGCSQRNPKANQVFMAEDARRLRPPTPLNDNDRRITTDRLTMSFQLQRDKNDGGWITPCYSVESEPSIIYDPPGVTLKHKMRNWWFGLFDRMDPIAARRFRKIQFREATDPITPLDTTSERSVSSSSNSDDAAADIHKRPYTDAEVLEALHSSSCRRVAGVAPQNAPLIISQRWQTVTRWKAQDADLVRENDQMRGAIERAKIELREIRLTVDHLLQKKAAEEMAMRQRRHKRILRQVSAHLHELRYEIQSKFDALKHAQTQNQSMKAELALLEWQIKNECARAELSSPDEVRKAVSEHFRNKLAALDLVDCF